MSSTLSITVLSEHPIDVTAALFDLSQITKDYKDYQFDVNSTQVISPSVIIYGVSFIEKLFTPGIDGLLQRNENRKSKTFTIMTNSLDQSIEVDDFNQIPLKDGLHSLHIIGTAYVDNKDDVTTNDVLFRFIDMMISRNKNASIVLRDDILNESIVMHNKHHLLNDLQKVNKD